MKAYLSAVVKALVEFGEERAPDEPARDQLRALLEDAGILERSLYGRAGSEADLGQQVVIQGESGGFLTARIFYDDFIEPLILRKGRAPRPAVAGSGRNFGATCCWTNGSICCGAQCTDTVVDDPCPEGNVVLDLPYRYARETHLRRLFEPERELAFHLADLASRLFAKTKAPEVKGVEREVGKLRAAYAHRELLFTSELDEGGTWFDWILKLSNGSVLTLQVINSPARKPMAYREGDDVAALLKNSTWRWSFQQTDLGPVVGVFRAECR